MKLEKQLKQLKQANNNTSFPQITTMAPATASKLDRLPDDAQTLLKTLSIRSSFTTRSTVSVRPSFSA